MDVGNNTMKLALCLIGLILSHSAIAQESTQMSDDAIRKAIIQQSTQSYSWSCPCPYNSDKAGRPCGKSSAHIRPGGTSPKCYASDVSDNEVQRNIAKVTQ